MKIAYFDCFAGGAGDMIVASLIDAGAQLDKLQELLKSLPVDGYDVSTRQVTQGGMSATKFDVNITHDHHHHHYGDQDHHHHRNLHDITDILESSDLPKRPVALAKMIFTNLARAEAQVHGTTIEKVHFHEVGAVDSIVDIVSACLALEMLEINQICCNAIPTGNGTIKCDHGLIPAPAPATARLLAAVKCPTFPSPNTGEATTPTAAAILTTLATFAPMPAMKILSVGYGCGTREGDKIPNILRVFIGETSDSSQVDSLVEISANIDDASGELVGYAVEKLITAGCVDVWVTPAYTKKSRPCWILSCLAAQGLVEQAENIIFSQTTTLGLRKRIVERTKLEVKFATVDTPYGPVRVKTGSLGSQMMTAAAEFEDAKKAAEAGGVSVKQVMQAAIEKFNNRQ